jgi:hypothetical protein
MKRYQKQLLLIHELDGKCGSEQILICYEWFAGHQSLIVPENLLHNSTINSPELAGSISSDLETTRERGQTIKLQSQDFVVK